VRIVKLALHPAAVFPDNPDVAQIAEGDLTLVIAGMAKQFRFRQKHRRRTEQRGEVTLI
jgi:hypothetical protein